MIMFLITSVEAVAYWTPHYYENEYTRYQVADDVHMEMDDLLYVTDEMMAYLRGSRDDLNIDTVVDGTPREFFPTPGKRRTWRMSATSFSEDWRCAASACFWQRHRLHCWHF